MIRRLVRLLGVTVLLPDAPAVTPPPAPADTVTDTIEDAV